MDREGLCQICLKAAEKLVCGHFCCSECNMCLMSLAEAKYMLETLDGISRVFRPFCIVCALYGSPKTKRRRKARRDPPVGDVERAKKQKFLWSRSITDLIQKELCEEIIGEDESRDGCEICKLSCIFMWTTFKDWLMRRYDEISYAVSHTMCCWIGDIRVCKARIIKMINIAEEVSNTEVVEYLSKIIEDMKGCEAKYVFDLLTARAFI